MIKEYESLIKKEYAKVYKEKYGKGPDHVQIRIIENIIIIKIEGALSQLELSLMESEGGKELVTKIRDEMGKRGVLYRPIVEKVTGLKVTGNSHYLDKDKNAFYVFVIMEEEILQN